MKGKIILHAIGNEGNFNFYIFDKKQVVAEIISKLFSQLFNLYWDFYYEGFKKGKRIRKNIEKYKEGHESITDVNGSKSRIDIFYGTKKMFITIHCSEKLRLRFNEELFKFTKMPKPKKLKKIK